MENSKELPILQTKEAKFMEIYKNSKKDKNGKIVLKNELYELAVLLEQNRNMNLDEKIIEEIVFLVPALSIYKEYQFYSIRRPIYDVNNIHTVKTFNLIWGEKNISEALINHIILQNIEVQIQMIKKLGEQVKRKPNKGLIKKYNSLKIKYNHFEKIILGDLEIRNLILDNVVQLFKEVQDFSDSQSCKYKEYVKNFQQKFSKSLCHMYILLTEDLGDYAKGKIYELEKWIFDNLNGDMKQLFAEFVCIIPKMKCSISKLSYPEYFRYYLHISLEDFKRVYAHNKDSIDIVSFLPKLLINGRDDILKFLINSNHISIEDFKERNKYRVPLHSLEILKLVPIEHLPSVMFVTPIKSSHRKEIETLKYWYKQVKEPISSQILSRYSAKYFADIFNLSGKIVNETVLLASMGLEHEKFKKYFGENQIAVGEWAYFLGTKYLESHYKKSDNIYKNVNPNNLYLIYENFGYSPFTRFYFESFLNNPSQNGLAEILSLNQGKDIVSRILRSRASKNLSPLLVKQLAENGINISY